MENSGSLWKYGVEDAGAPIVVEHVNSGGTAVVHLDKASVNCTLRALAPSGNAAAVQDDTSGTVITTASSTYYADYVTGPAGFTSTLTVPVAPGAAPSAQGSVAYDSTAHVPVWGLNTGVGRVPTFLTTLSPAAGDCPEWINATQLGDVGPCTAGVTQGLVLQFTCAALVVTGTTVFLDGQPCATGSMGNAIEFQLPYQSGTYTFKNLYVAYKGTANTSDTVTLWVGGSATMLSCNLNPSGTAPCPDLTHAPTITPSTARNYSMRVTTNSSDTTLGNILVTVQLQ